MYKYNSTMSERYDHSCRFTDKFTGKRVITLDYEEDAVITAQFTDPIRCLK